MYTYVKYIFANQFFYGFNMRCKLETSTHENQNPPIIHDFLNFICKAIDVKALFGTYI